MCHAFEVERRLFLLAEQREREMGKPYRCEAQAGYYQCDGEVWRVYREGKGPGWECRDCGCFYPEKPKE
jgi:hypothetical protein